MRKKKINGEYKKDLIRKGIIALCEEKGIKNVNQVNVSRALAELKIRQRENHYWVMDYDNSQQDEIEKLSDMFRKSKEPPRIYNVKILFIKTDNYRNTMIAQQIKDAFPDRVISTICPNEFDIIVFYRTRKNDGLLIQEIKAIRDRKKVIKKSRSKKT